MDLVQYIQYSSSLESGIKPSQSGFLELVNISRYTNRYSIGMYIKLGDSC